ncbi:fatty acid hydroxylase [Plesiocystis pacifica SIR-1]|uniref:Fatty acid hydroxylase n=1 Tax=Plesiocystis pacifica SIR-1 TaxID=391625 RepID=A6GF21_9BACT|nr:sterol desaturase family protein [Plesiocystis pacifica]EDM75548.1 fatty acid hydroxylase [Plesiocystis pacifica SIR-1]
MSAPSPDLSDYPGGYTINRKGAGRQFDNDFLEAFSRCHGSIPLIIYAPVVGWLFYRTATTTELGVAATVGLTLAGIFVWTLAEYWLHRIVFHFERMPKLHYFLHGIHHVYPNDKYRMVMPPGASAVPAVLFWLLAWALLGRDMALPAFAGFAIGYLWYDMTHWWTHVGKARTPWGKKLRKHHMLHHFKDHDLYFGVSTPLWDWVFGTLPKE